MCQLHDVPLNKYLMELTESFKSQRRENAIGKPAASCQGLNGKGTWVLNQQVQVDQDGNQLAEESTEFIWLGKYTSRYNVVPQKYAAPIETPLNPDSLGDVLKQLKKCSGMLKARKPVVIIDVSFNCGVTFCLFQPATNIGSPKEGIHLYCKIIFRRTFQIIENYVVSNPYFIRRDQGC